MARRTSRSFIQQRKSRLLWVVAVSGTIAVVLVILEITDVTHIFHKTTVPPVIPVTTPSASNSSSASSATQGNPPNSSTSKDTSPTGSTSSNLPLLAPYGDFVSNHHPGQQGSPTKETSVCNTTPGANCYIRFTKGSLSTSLPTQTADSKGTAYWSWDVKTAGLTKGDWTITAVATLGNQTKSTRDPLPLSVE